MKATFAKSLFIFLLGFAPGVRIFAQAGDCSTVTNDIGMQMNNQITDLKGSCGVITIPNGTYTLKTPIVKPKCVLIDG